MQHLTTEILYPVMESFYTIQGEGFHQGRSAWFIRLAGCDVGCVWCDVKESWDKAKHPQHTIQDILQPIISSPATTVVITGGEPLMHNCTPLIQALQQLKLTVHVETSGAYPLIGNWDWVTLSPKKFKAPLPHIINQAHELKVVIYNQSDFAWAEAHAACIDSACMLYLQPEWSKREQVTPLIVAYIKANPQWRMSNQLHKYINVP